VQIKFRMEDEEMNDEMMRVPGIFNPDGDDGVERRSMWLGDTTHLMQLNDVRYPWAVGLYKQMREQFWIPEKLDLTPDITSYNELSRAERRAYDGMLSYLTFLDSIQTTFVPVMKGPITAPEVALCMVEQASQEGMHNQAYQFMIETVIPTDRRRAVYDFWRTDPVLLERCRFVAGLYDGYLGRQTSENYFYALVADYLLEGLYFYNGFVQFYSYASRGLMPGSADVFRLINRDELSHVRLYQKILAEAMEVFPHSKDRVLEMFATAVEHECQWTDHITDGEILGIDGRSTEAYTKYLANLRLRAIGLDELYPGDDFRRSPYAHLERFADTKADAHTKANFFEAGVTSYVMSSGIGGWDDLV